MQMLQGFAHHGVINTHHNPHKRPYDHTVTVYPRENVHQPDQTYYAINPTKKRKGGHLDVGTITEDDESDGIVTEDDEDDDKTDSDTANEPELSEDEVVVVRPGRGRPKKGTTTKKPPKTKGTGRTQNIKKFLFENERVVKKKYRDVDGYINTNPIEIETIYGNGSGDCGYHTEPEKIWTQITSCKKNLQVLLEHDVLYNNAHRYQFVVDFPDTIDIDSVFWPRVINIKSKEILYSKNELESMKSSSSTTENASVFDCDLLYKLHNVSTGRIRYVWKIGFNFISYMDQGIVRIFNIALFMKDIDNTRTVGVPIYFSPPFGIVARKLPKDAIKPNSVHDKILQATSRVWYGNIRKQ
jgi:hypothetical protein